MLTGRVRFRAGEGSTLVLQVEVQTYGTMIGAPRPIPQSPYWRDATVTDLTEPALARRFA